MAGWVSLGIRDNDIKGTLQIIFVTSGEKELNSIKNGGSDCLTKT